MGNLKPGASYTYEKENGVTYARETNDPNAERFVIGWDYVVQEQIVLAATTNPALRDALDRVLVLYNLSKKPNSDEPIWHPV